MPEPLRVYIGYDSRESELSDICAHSIKRRTQADVKFHFLKHRALRKAGLFRRPWQIRSDDGESIDLIDNKPFSTEFSHTRFLVPALMNYQGWALFCDADMVFLSDIADLFKLCQDHCALMCVKHNHTPANMQKMDGRMQLQYHRKNWSSFVLWNCGHKANRVLTADKVNTMTGADLHRFAWVPDHEIGELPKTYNWISGLSPQPVKAANGKVIPPACIHYTEGGPWFDNCKNVPLADYWEAERRDWIEDGEVYDGGIR